MRHTTPRSSGRHVAFQAARKRSKRLTRLDKANVLRPSVWRDIVTEVSPQCPGVALGYVRRQRGDAAGAALKKFDVVVTGNMFGDILRRGDVTGSIGAAASASLDAPPKGLHEAEHGGAPDIAGKDRHNPLAHSVCRHDARFDQPCRARRSHRACGGSRCWPGCARPTSGRYEVGTRAMGDAVVAALAQTTAASAVGTKKTITKS
jgi:3-isopropylmalate dehydrogenase